MNWNDFEIQIKTFYGLEEVLASEIKKLGGSNIDVRNRAVACSGDLMFLYKLNYSLRTALKIIVPIEKFKAGNEEELYERSLRFPWEDYIGEDDSFYIDYTVFSEHFNHSQFAMLKVKDAIVDRLKKVYGERPSVSTDENAIKINLHIQNQNVTLSLDSSGEPLYKRGYRIEKGEAPINEVLAAGLIGLSNWEAGSHFLDPMCGSGTILIEACMYAYEIPAQIHRKHFAFMNWKNFNPGDWEKIKQIRNQKIREFPYSITGYDKDENMLKKAGINIKNADLQDLIQLQCVDFFETKKENSPLLMLANPPYNQRLSVNEEFYGQIGDTLKQSYPYSTMWLISSDLSMDKQVGLKASKKIKLYNGKLECKFVEYETYAGSKKQKYQEGN